MAHDEVGTGGGGLERGAGHSRGARDTLQELEDVRVRLGSRLATPWWYKGASALLVAALFAGAGMPYASIPFGTATARAFVVLLAVVVGPVLLRRLLMRSTGASLDRYRNGWTAPSMALIGLLLASLSLQAFAEVDLAPLVGAAVGAVLTYRYEQRIDRRLARGEFPGGRTAAP